MIPIAQRVTCYLSLFPNSELEKEMVCSQQKLTEVLRVEEGKKIIIKMGDVLLW